MHSMPLADEEQVHGTLGQSKPLRYVRTACTTRPVPDFAPRFIKDHALRPKAGRFVLSCTRNQEVVRIVVGSDIAFLI